MLEELRGWAGSLQGQHLGCLGLWQKQPFLPGIQLLSGRPQDSVSPWQLGCMETGWEPLSGNSQVYESPQRSSSQRSSQLEKQFSRDFIGRIHEGCLTKIKGKNRTGWEAPTLDHPSQ